MYMYNIYIYIYIYMYILGSRCSVDDVVSTMQCRRSNMSAVAADGDPRSIDWRRSGASLGDQVGRPGVVSGQLERPKWSPGDASGLFGRLSRSGSVERLTRLTEAAD